MKKVVFLLMLSLSIFSPSHSFAIIATTTQTALIEKPVLKDVKKSTKITLGLSFLFIALGYLLKVIGASSGIIIACYVLALICAILCLGSLFQN